jgi:hypothetical protein
MPTVPGSIIKIKRSATQSAPGTLAVGELAYTYGVGTKENGGDRLYFGAGPADVNGNADNITVIGGKYFTDMLSHVKGKLTDSAAIVVDADRKVDQLRTTKITIGTNTTGTATGATNEIGADGDLILYPSSGTVYIGSMYALPTTRSSSSGYVLTAGVGGTTTWSAPSTSLYVSGDEGAELKIDILSETFEIGGDSDQGVYTIGYAGSSNGYAGSSGGNNLNVSVRNAGYNGSKGVAAFNAGDFSISSGNVSLGGSVPRFFTGDNGYVGSTVNSTVRIVGDSTSGIKTTVSDTNQIRISGEIPSESQRGTASFSVSHFYVGSAGSPSPGLVNARIATNATVGMAKFSSTFFEEVTEQGTVSIKLATTNAGASPVKGVASFESTQFSVATGVVTAKKIYLGTTPLELGEGVNPETGIMIPGGANNSITGLSDVTIDKIKISTNVIEYTTTDAGINTGDIVLKPYTKDGYTTSSGKIKINDAWTLPNDAGTNGYVLTTNGSDTATWKEASSKLNITDGTTNVEVDLLRKALHLDGDDVKGIFVSTAGYLGTWPGFRVSTRYAGYLGSADGVAAESPVGMASYEPGTFSISTYGGVDVKAGGIKNTQLANSKVTIGTTDVTLGSSATAFSGLTQLNFSSASDLSIKGYQGSVSSIYSTQSIHIQSTGIGPYQGYVKIGTEGWNLPNSKGTADYVLTSDGSGGTGWSAVPRVQFINHDGSGLTGGYVGSFKLGVETLSIFGDGPIYTDMTDQNLFIGVATATYDNLGVAKFKDTDFVVNSGLVEIKGEYLKSVTNNSGTAVPYAHDLKILGYTGSATDARANAIFTVGYGGSNSGNPNGGKMDIVARLATDTLAGIASFDSKHFYTGSSTGATSGGVQARNFYIGSTSFNLGQDPTTVIGGLTDVTIGELRISNTNRISSVSTNADADIILSPKGLGVVDVDNSRIKNVATPISDNDAVNKLYADALVSGLDVKVSVRAATDAPLDAVYTPAYGYLGSVGNYGKLTSAVNEALVIDGVTVANGDRVLIKDQGIVYADGLKVGGIVTTEIDASAISANELRLKTTVITVPKGTKFKTPVGFSGVTGLAANTTYYIANNVVASSRFTLAATYADAVAETNKISISGTPTGTLTGASIGDADAAKGNGIYTVTDLGTGSRPWVLTRAADSDEMADVNAGMFTFIEEGNVWLNAGFILITPNPITVGSTSLIFTQFSSAGRVLAGDGLDKIGDNISIVASPTSGITVNADSIEISSTIAGNALTFTSGVLSVGFDNSTVGYTGSVTKQLRIHESYPGQASISTVGTITGGTWKGNKVEIEYGGTGRTSFLKGDLLYGNGYAGSMSVLTMSSSKFQVLRVGDNYLPEWSDIDGGTY